MQDATNITELDLVVLEQEVINLHNAARALEQAFGGPGPLSENIRSCADRLSDILKVY
jgi:hypothetical protein